MDILWIVIWVLLSIIGIIGVILPGLPGAQLGYIGLIVVQLTLGLPFSRWFLAIRGIINIGLIVLDYALPIIGTKKFWGTKRGNIWCIVGIIIGVFFWPPGIICGPFIGAVTGEFLHQQNIQKALKAGFWAFLGFLSGIIIKLVVAIVMFGYLLAVSIQHFL